MRRVEGTTQAVPSGTSACWSTEALCCEMKTPTKRCSRRRVRPPRQALARASTGQSAEEASGMDVYSGDSLLDYVYGRRAPRPTGRRRCQRDCRPIARRLGPAYGERRDRSRERQHRTTRATVAKNTFAMAGGFIESTFTLKGDILALTQVRNASGPIQNPSTITWRRTR